MKQSPENVSRVDDTSSTPTDICNSSASSVDGRKSAELGKVAAGDFTVPPSVSLGHTVPNGFSVIKSCQEVKPGTAAGQTECSILQTGSVDQQYSMSSFPTCVQSSCSVLSPGASLLSFPTSALHLSSQLPFANRQPSALNWDVKNSSVSPINSIHTSQHSVAELLTDQSASKFPMLGHFSRSENSRHRSVKAGSTWFPTELQKSLDCGSAKKRTVEPTRSARTCSSSVLNSPLKQFVDRQRTRIPAQNISRVSDRFSCHQTAVSSARYATEPVADQPIDLSIQRRKTEPKSEQNLVPNRTHVNTTASDEPLDLSQSSSGVRSDIRTSRHSSHSGRPADAARASDSGCKLPSGVIDLQNYCSLLLSGGYPLDSPLSTVTSSSSFSSLVSKVYLPVPSVVTVWVGWPVASVCLCVCPGFKGKLFELSTS